MTHIDVYDWEDVDRLCRQLARAIDEDFDAIVCVLRGGAVPGAILANELDIDTMLGVKVEQRGQASGVASRGDQAYRAERGVVTVPLNGVALDGASVLVVDDVLDSGESARVVLDTVRAAGAGTVKLATMQVKTYSSFLPDYYVEVREHWLFYPWMSAREFGEMRARLAAAPPAEAPAPASASAPV